ASTTQLYDPRRRDWSARLIDALGFPSHLFPKVVPSGTVLGTLEESLRFETGLKEVEVIASCSHDTAAAVAAVPAEDEDWAYLSSGTWSLLGVERSSPLLTDACRDLNVTNEIGFGGSVRLLKNIVGLWIIQECRRAWAAGGQRWDYAQLTALAEAARPFVALINPADPRFLSPGGMPEKIQAFCRETDQPAPETPGAIVRCVLESMALLYHRTLRQIEQVTGRTIRRLHIVGGGSQNGLLNQFTADALEIPVVAGPVEATALGNILVQAIACRLIGGLDEARRLVRDSCEVAVLMPRAKERMSWARSVARFERLFSSTALGC
ncbi:MAG TPA: FGGY-family carbohydrate kinase, partial [Methylomirabilota bacterium]|nr:FGGY-family carbohydrate kinase [Methylomirabilota bacterium]